MSYSNKIVDYYIRQEEINCIESMPVENLKNFGLFVKYVSSHILYSLIDLEFKGSSIKIVRWIENFWATHKQCEEVEPKKKEETEEETEQTETEADFEPAVAQGRACRSA